MYIRIFREESPRLEIQLFLFIIIHEKNNKRSRIVFNGHCWANCKRCFSPIHHPASPTNAASPGGLYTVPITIAVGTGTSAVENLY